MNGNGTDGLVVGIGVAACAACCAGPVLGFLAATGMFTVAGVAAIGAVGLLVLVPAALWWIRRSVRRRRRRRPCAAPEEPVPVEVTARP
ncbi:MAG: hypothetical protein ACRD0W_10095 [Acidimicrobiales bacterium]